MDLSLNVAGAQIIGARNYQEDVFLIASLGSERNPTGQLVIVADGMGGHAAGHVASRLVVDAFKQHIVNHYPSDTPIQLLREGVEKANEAIAVAIQETATLQGMGCTLVAALFEKSEVRWVSVGDSHLYLVRGQEIAKKNADHSYGGLLARLAAEGKPIDQEVAHLRNMLFSALTGGPIAEIDAPSAPLRLCHGDRVILSTDGLNTLSQETILAISAESKSAKSFVDTVLHRVTGAQAHNQDNTTVVAIDVQARSFASASPFSRSSRKTTSILKTETAASQTASHKARAIASKKNQRSLFVVLALTILAGGIYLLVQERPSEVVQPPAPETPSPIAPLESLTTETAQEDRETMQRIATPLIPSKPFQDRLRIGGWGPKMLWMESGSFQMGNPRAGADHDEQPSHTVQLDRFAISQYEIANGDYAAFAKDTGRPLPGDHSPEKKARPVVMISWQDAVEYTRWLSQQTGHKYHLPSEAEWEYAASGGTTTPFWWGFEVGQGHAHCVGCGANRPRREPVPVGSFKPNPYGLYDTAGNVLEWVQDCYHKSYVGASADGRPRENGNCPARVARGGAFSTAASSLRTTKRNQLKPELRYDDVGIRVVREP